MGKDNDRQLSRVEIFGFEALFYEELLTPLSLGVYPLRFFMEKIECPLAIRFLQYPLEKVLKKAGFREIEHRFYARDIIRFTRATK